MNGFFVFASRVPPPAPQIVTVDGVVEEASGFCFIGGPVFVYKFHRHGAVQEAMSAKQVQRRRLAGVCMVSSIHISLCIEHVLARILLHSLIAFSVHTTKFWQCD